MANQFASTSLAATLSNLKNWYAGPIVSQFNDEMPFYREVEKGKEKFAGLQVVRAMKVRRNQGIGATSDGGVLPAIGVQTTINAQITAKLNYLRFGVTGPMIKASQGDKAAFVSQTSYEMEQGLNDLKNDVNRQLFWDGSGDLALVNAAAVASTSIVVKGRESTEDGSKYVGDAVGMVIDILDSNGAYKAQGVSITATSGTTLCTLTLSSAVTVAADDVVVRSGSYNNEVQGLLYTLDGGTSTIYGIDRSAYQVTQGNVVNASGGQLTLNLMQQAYNQGKVRGGAKYDVFYCDYDSERFYNKLLIADKRYIGTVKGDGTFSSKTGSYLEFAGLPLVPDKDSPQRFWFLDSKTWKKYVLSELEWADESGSQYIAQTSTDAYEARLRLFFNMFCEKASANVCLKNYISP